MNHISREAACLWAKKSRENETAWLPLLLHMADSAGVAKELWRSWLSEGIKQSISQSLVCPGEDARDIEAQFERARKTFIFTAAVHDLGKATPVFQSKSQNPRSPGALDEILLEKQIRSGLPMPADGCLSFRDPGKSPHALATQLLLRRYGCDRSLASILGAHHGKPSNSAMLQYQGIGAYGMNYHLGKEGKEKWEAVQREVLQFALELTGFSSIIEIPVPSMAAQVLLSGLVIITDWIASNEACFPYLSLNQGVEEMLAPEAIIPRIKWGWEKLDLPPCWNAEEGWKGTSLYPERFSSGKEREFKPNTMQTEAAGIAQDVVQPGIIIIEAPMGQGKTEAALVVSEIFAHKSGRSGLFFALPTQATSDGIFPRIKAWASELEPGRRHSIRLSHGKAQFNQEYWSLFEGGSNVGIDEADPLTVHPWFEGQKKSLLADFVVGTVDQLLMSALKQKHVMLRHAGLAGKAVIIDECHAYDAYMNQYLDRALNWLGAYGVPVIMLSATLPASRRRRLVEAYLNGQAQIDDTEKDQWQQSRGYPLITWTDGSRVGSRTLQPDGRSNVIELGSIPSDGILDYLKSQLKEGGCAGLILNTVKKAQEMAACLQAEFGDAVELLHSRFIAPDRAEKERKLLRELGKPREGQERPPLRVVVGTQVLEQSLDIDFDLMITELCPMDLLLQRIGRLHRHERKRPRSLEKARCLIIDRDAVTFDTGSESIYGRYLLMRTRAFLPADSLITLPRDIPKLVQDVYDSRVLMPKEVDGYERASKDWESYRDYQEERADRFRVASAQMCVLRGIDSWLDLEIDDSEQTGEATVRDTDESIEVLLIRSLNDNLHFLPWQEGGRQIPIHQPLSIHDAEALARQRIRLPNQLCKPYILETTIKVLEQMTSRYNIWQESPWIKGELILVINDDGFVALNGYRIHYSQKIGLIYEKEKP